MSEDENVETQLDRLNDAIARTLEEAKKAAYAGHTGDLIPRELEVEQIESQSSDDIGINFSDYDSNLSGVLASEGGYYSEAVFVGDSEYQDYVESLILQLERTGMLLEDYLSSQQREQPSDILPVTQTVVLSDQDVFQLFQQLETLQATSETQLQIGNILINASFQGEIRGGAGWGRDPEDLMDVFRMGGRRRSLEREDEGVGKREADLLWELKRLRIEKTNLEEKHERLMETVRRQNRETLCIKDQIEVLLMEHEESASELSSIYCGDDRTGPHQKLDSELDVLRKQIQSLELDEEESIGLKKDMDLAEDVLVRVINGDDPRKLYLQMTVIKNKIVQYRGRQVIRDTEKMASSITTALQALEHDRQLQKSKNRIKDKLVKKLTSPINSPLMSPAPEEKMRGLQRQVIVSMESVSSPMDSPRTGKQFDLSISIPSGPISIPSHLDIDLKRQLSLAEERVAKLRLHVRDLQAKLDRYKALERRMIEEQYYIKTAKNRLDIFKSALDTRETELIDREKEVAILQDNLRTEAAKCLENPQESREFLKLQAQLLIKQSQKACLEKMTVDLNKAEMKAAREELIEFRKMVERQRKKLVKDQAKVEKDKKRVEETKREMEKLLRVM